MSSEAVDEQKRRRRWVVLTAVVLGLISLGFYISALVVQHMSFVSGH